MRPFLRLSSTLSLLLLWLLNPILPLTRPAAAADDWKTIKADHFVVYYKNEESFSREIARKSDAYYSQIASDLGYERYSNFWLWDNRVKIFIYPTEEEFKRLPGTNEWSSGMANHAKKEIYSYSGQTEFTESVLPHEITHLIFRDFVGTSKAIPLWLDEGVAQWEEPAKRALAKKYTQSLVATGTAYSVSDLFRMRSSKLSDKNDVQKFYMQSVSLVDFLVRTYGGTAFTAFCRQLRDGKNVNEALKKAYPNSVRDMDDLDLQWKKYASAP